MHGAAVFTYVNDTDSGLMVTYIQGARDQQVRFGTTPAAGTGALGDLSDVGSTCGEWSTPLPLSSCTAAWIQVDDRCTSTLRAQHYNPSPPTTHTPKQRAVTFVTSTPPEAGAALVIRQSVARKTDWAAVTAQTLAKHGAITTLVNTCILYTSPSPRNRTRTRMPASA